MASTERPARGEIWLVSIGAGRRGEPAKTRRAIRAVAVRRLLRRVGKARPQTLLAVEGAVAVILGLDAGR